MTSEKDRRRWLTWTLLSTAAVIVVTLRVPQQLYSDAAWQLKCLQQYTQGQSPSLNHLASPDPRDLSRNVTSWGSWWPPGILLLTYPMVAHGIPIGDAVRLITVAFLLLGCVGWVFWFSLFDLPDWVQGGLALFLPWIRYPSNVLFFFSSEILVFGTAPWVLWATYRLTESWRKKTKCTSGVVIASGLLGFGLGFRYILKYSSVFVSLAALIYLGWQWFRAKRECKAPMTIALGMVALFFLAPVLGLNVLNRLMGSGMNNVTASAHLHLGIRNILWAISGSALGLADADSLLRFILMHPSHGLYPDEFAACLLGVPGGIALLGILFYRRPFRGPAVLAMITFCTALLCLLGIWSISTGAGHEGRYLETSDMAILPIAIEAGLLLWRRKSAALWRAGLALMAALYLVIPFLYGFISVGAKVMRVPRHFRLSSTHLYNELMANDDLEAVRAGLLKDFNPATDIWYLPDPSTALELPGRAIIQHADFTDIAVLERNHFLSSAPLRVWVLLPPRFEASGKGTVIRRSFSQAGPWTSRSVPGCHFVLWRSDIQ